MFKVFASWWDSKTQVTCSDLPFQGAEVATSLFLSRACAASVAARGAWPPHGPPLPSASSGSRRYVLTCSLTCKRGLWCLWMVEKDGKRWKKSFQQPKKERSWGPMCSNVVQCGPHVLGVFRAVTSPSRLDGVELRVAVRLQKGQRSRRSVASWFFKRPLRATQQPLSSHSAATRADVWLLTIEIL